MEGVESLKERPSRLTMGGREVALPTDGDLAGKGQGRRDLQVVLMSPLSPEHLATPGLSTGPCSTTTLASPSFSLTSLAELTVNLQNAGIDSTRRPTVLFCALPRYRPLQ